MRSTKSHTELGDLPPPPPLRERFIAQPGRAPAGAVVAGGQPGGRPWVDLRDAARRLLGDLPGDLDARCSGCGAVAGEPCTPRWGRVEVHALRLARVRDAVERLHRAAVHLADAAAELVEHGAGVDLAVPLRAARELVVVRRIVRGSGRVYVLPEVAAVVEAAGRCGR